MMKGTESKVPRVRFNGLVGEWEQKKLGEIYTERNERGNDSLQILSVSIHSGISKGELDSETLGKQVRRSEDKSLYKHVYAGDLVLNMMRAWQGAIGVATIEGMVSPAYITAVPNGAIYPPFMDCCLRRSQIIAQMNNLSYGVTDFRKRLYWGSFIRIESYVPPASEQKKLTAYFSHLDNLIALHQRKHDKLVTLKQAMLQKMFPQDGATTPEIRFKGFEGEWRRKKLEDVATLTNGRAYSQHELLDKGRYRVLRVGNFYTNSSWYFSDMELGEKYYANKGDLLYTWSASFGPHIWNGEKVIYHYHIWKVELSEELRREFALQLLEYDKQRILSTSSGSTMIHLTKEGMEAKEFVLPEP